MPQWDGGLDKQLKNHVSVWPRIARFLEQQCVAYEYLIPLVFMNWSSSTAPLPTHFLSPTVVQEYAAALPSFLEQLDSTLRSQWAQFQTTQTLKICSGLSEYDAAVFAIGDPLTPINGLFRYILASRLPSPEQMQIFEECAWEQAQATRWLLRQTAWAQLVPEEWLQ